MKKIIIIGLLCISQNIFATTNRIAAMGGEIAMLPDDDTNIDLFPQHINRWQLLRLSNISSGEPDYAIVIGEKGDKWGLYGGQNEVGDFFNIYHSFNETTAIKASLLLATHNHEQESDNNETPVTKSKADNEYGDFDLRLRFGQTRGERELAGSLQYANGPGVLENAIIDDFHGNYDASFTQGTNTSSQSGEADVKFLRLGFDLREPRKIALFNHLYINAQLTKFDLEERLESAGNAIEHDNFDQWSISGFILLFNQKKIADHSVLVYGIGTSAIASRSVIEDKADPTDRTRINSIRIGGPHIRLGLETDIKYGKLRFGIQRNMDLYVYRDARNTFQSGANSDDVDDLESGIGKNASYAFVSGYGMEYKNLKIDLTLNNNFWVSGPQMIFDSQFGTFGLSADVLYTF